jgi:hypothetical protein
LAIFAVIMGALFFAKRMGLAPRLILSWDLAWQILIYILLAFGVLGFLAKAWSIAVVLAHLPSTWLVSPSGDPGIDIVSTGMYGIALYGVFRWKKWGAYLIFVRLAFTICMQLFLYHSASWNLVAGYTGADNLFADLSGAFTWLLAFVLAWKRFS